MAGSGPSSAPSLAALAVPTTLPLPAGIAPAAATAGVDQGLAFVSFSSPLAPTAAAGAYDRQLLAAGFTFTGTAGAWRGYVSQDLAIEVQVALSGPPTRITVRYDPRDPHNPPGQVKVLATDGPVASPRLPDPPSAREDNRPSVPPGQAVATGAPGGTGATGADGSGGGAGNGNNGTGNNGNGNNGNNGTGNGNGNNGNGNNGTGNNGNGNNGNGNNGTGNNGNGNNGNGNNGTGNNGTGTGANGANGNGNAATTSAPTAPPSATPTPNPHGGQP